MARETFKGADCRLLVRINTPQNKMSEEDLKNRKGPLSRGFDDTVRTVDGLYKGISTHGTGGGASGKSILKVPIDLKGRQLSLLSSIEKEIKNTQICERVSLIKDNVKELVKEAYLKSRELSRIKDESQYTIDPIVDQKPHETEQEVTLGTISDYMRLENSVRKEINTIQRRLFDLVTDEKAPRWIPGEDKGKRIDRRLLARIPFGERNFFKYKIETDILNIAFSLVIDESGSMSGEKAQQARRCAIMFGKILDKLGVPFEIIGYTTGDLTSSQVAKAQRRSERGKDGRAYDRSWNLAHFMYKRFNEEYNRIRTKLTKISSHGGNYDQDSVEFVWNRLQKYCFAHGIERKVMIVISDGQPNGGSVGRKKLKRIINEIGCDPNAEIIGIGICSGYVKDFYHKCVEIDQIEQLGINVVRLIQSAIKKGRRKW